MYNRLLVMPVTYQIDRDGGFIETHCTGAVTLDEVLDHFHELETDPKTPNRLDVLLDLDGMTTVPESQDLREVTQAVKRLTGQVTFGSCAIVASRDVVFGMSRMFEVFAEGLFGRTHVFRERRDAERWLATARSAGGA